jgi:hypothetical protein
LTTSSGVSQDSKLLPQAKVRTREQEMHFVKVTQRNSAIAAGPGSGLPCPAIYGGRR